MSDVFKAAGQPTTTTRATLPKLNQPLRKTNQGQEIISYIAPIGIIYKFPKNDRIYSTYKELRSIFFHRINNKASSIYNQF